LLPPHERLFELLVNFSEANPRGPDIQGRSDIGPAIKNPVRQIPGKRSLYDDLLKP